MNFLKDPDGTCQTRKYVEASRDPIAPIATPALGDF
jgi:hypothetical protein